MVQPERLRWVKTPLQTSIAAIFLSAIVCCLPRDLSAAEYPTEPTRFSFVLNVELENGVPNRIRGTLKVRNWNAQDKKYCLFLPYNWQSYGSDRGALKRFNDITAQSTLPKFSGGGTTLSVGSPVTIDATDIDHNIQLMPPKGWGPGEEFVFELESNVPTLPDVGADEFFFDGFLPVITAGCAPSGAPSPASAVPVIYEGVVHTPEGWHYVGSGHLKSTNVVEVYLKSRSYAFALTRNLKLLSQKAGHVPVDIFYTTDEFKSVATTLTEALPIIESYLGAFPFENLNVIESAELQRNNIPELIAINRPGQSFANKIQKDWLNWMHWTAVTQLVRQWFGASIDARPQDEWLISGLVELITLETLAQMPHEYDLIQADKDGHKYFSFNYLQMSEFTAASLRRLAPYTALTDVKRVSIDTASSQHGLAYIRHAFALRQIMYQTGKKEFASFLRTLVNRYQNSQITPEDFYQMTQKLPSPFSPVVRNEIAKNLMQWWTDYDWPDFAIEDFAVKEHSGKFISEILVTQEGTIDFAPIIEVKDDSGGSVTQRAVKNENGLWSASISTRFRPTISVVDPEHESFDSDRFNNRTGFSGIALFPGPGKTVHDDRYSVVWFPYAYRLPGEPFTLGVGSAVFKYVQSGLLGRIETAPTTNQWSYQLRQMYTIPNWAIKGELAVKYDFDNDRISELNAIRSPIINSNSQVFSGQAKVRHKDHPGEPDQAHQTFAGDLTLKPKGQTSFFDYNAGVEAEVSPEQGRGFDYKRYRTVLVSGIKLTDRITTGARYFRGKTFFNGDAPQSAFFKPNEIKEANLKVDIRGIDRSSNLVSWEVSLGLPFYAPIPKDTLVLTRQIQWRFYYDWGKAYDLHKEYHSKGIGIVMPLGGDISGIGSLAVTRFTFLAILNSAAGSETKKRPGFVFDITGEL